MDAPTIAALTTVAGASMLTSILMQYIVLPLLNLQGEARDRWGPIASIVTGIIIVLVATVTLLPGGVSRLDIVQAVVTGIFAGLAAIGIHSVVKDTIRNE